MRPTQGEIYEDWCYRARMFEHGVAMQRIAQGEDLELVLEEMSKRLLAKLLDPCFEIAKEEVNLNYDKEKSKMAYKENYLDRVNPIADHVARD